MGTKSCAKPSSKSQSGFCLPHIDLTFASARYPGRDFPTSWQPISYERLALLEALLENSELSSLPSRFYLGKDVSASSLITGNLLELQDKTLGPTQMKRRTDSGPKPSW